MIASLNTHTLFILHQPSPFVSLSLPLQMMATNVHQVCHLLDPNVRCRPMPGRSPAAQVNTVNATMEAALANFPHLQPHVMSSDPWVTQNRHLYYYGRSP
jgi:hypothetical protein